MDFFKKILCMLFKYFNIDKNIYYYYLLGQNKTTLKIYSGAK